MTQLNVDPDPTPTATPWEEYLAAAQSLDAVCRDAAAAAAANAAATKAASATRGELARVSDRLGLQRARLTGEAVRAGMAAPQLTPSAAEQAAADARVAGDPASVPEALRRGQQLLDAADAELAIAAQLVGPVSPVAPTQPPARPVSPSPPATGGMRGWWPPALWLMIAVPLGVAAFLACATALLLIVVR